jgi:hypothetical protein
MITVVTPNTYDLPLTKKKPELSVFLAGTIDNGDSANWQKEVIEKLNKDKEDYEILVYNPRRDYWLPDASKEVVEEQIRWEQDHLDAADMIVMYLGDNSKSPISLLELGLYANKKIMYVFCSNKFYRFDNVRLTCEKYYIPLFITNDTDIVVEKVEELYEIMTGRFFKNC